jgi:hypothetical protein
MARGEYVGGERKEANAAVQGRNCHGASFAYFAKDVTWRLRPVGTPC